MKGLLIRRRHPDAVDDAKMTAVQCRSCGAVVGVLPWQDIPHYVMGIAEKLGVK